MASSAQTESFAFRGFSLGAGAGYTNDQTVAPEVSLHVNLKLFHRPFEPKIGVFYHRFDARFNGFDRLDARSTGVFLEAAIFPFYKYLFTGIRYDATFNWLTDNALRETGSDWSFNVFSGTNLYGIAYTVCPAYSSTK